MTTTAAEPSCPKCGGRMWDKKHDEKYPWKPGTPIWKCRTKECATAGGVIWEPKNGTPPVQAAPPKSSPSFASKPESELPPFLRDADAQDAAELASKVGVDLTGIQKQLAVYQGITEWYLDNIVPILTKADVGCSPESVTAGIATLFINSNGGKK